MPKYYAKTKLLWKRNRLQAMANGKPLAENEHFPLHSTFLCGVHGWEARVGGSASVACVMERRLGALTFDGFSSIFCPSTWCFTTTKKAGVASPSTSWTFGLTIMTFHRHSTLVSNTTALHTTYMFSLSKLLKEPIPNVWTLGIF